MADPFIGAIKTFSFFFAPKNYADCTGAMMPISTEQALFSLLGTKFGGDGRTTFALPDMRGRVPIHRTSSDYSQGVYGLGTRGGLESIQLTVNQIPSHSHALQAANTYNNAGPNPNSAVLAAEEMYANATDTEDPQPMYSKTIGDTGANKPHENMMPFLTLRFSIALKGAYPPRS